MLDLLFGASLVFTCVQGIKEAMQPTITAEQWGNKDLVHKDMMNGISAKQQIKNAQNGKYVLTEKYPEPHRNERGQIMIENCQLWHEDLLKYGSVKTNEWAKQCKYNLEGEELEKENQRIKEHLEKLYSLL